MRSFLTSSILSLVFFCSLTHGQTSNELVTVIGDSLTGKIVNGENVREIFGNVVITQGDIKITCDRAIQFLRKNEVELFGDVEVLQDTVRLLTDAGYYFGNDKIAYSDTGIIMHDGHMILAAMNGFYYMEEEKAYLYENVKLVDMASTLISDELTYFQNEDKTVSVGNVKIEDSASVIMADSLIHFRNSGDSYAYFNVQIKDSQNDLTIFGDELIDLKEKKYTKISGSPFLVQIDTTASGLLDTLLLSAGLLEAVTDSVRKLIATDSVKIIRGAFSSFNSNSVLFRDEDRILTFRKEDEKNPPILWYDNSQLIGDTVNIYLEGNRLEHIDIDKNALLVSIVEGMGFRFDQISGNNIKLFFGEEGLKQTNVSGSVLSIYYMFEGEEANGLIKSSADQTKIIFENKKLVDVRLYGSPASEYHPENLVEGKEKEFTLPTFILYENRPSKTEMLKRINKSNSTF